MPQVAILSMSLKKLHVVGRVRVPIGRNRFHNQYNVVQRCLSHPRTCETKWATQPNGLRL